MPYRCRQCAAELAHCHGALVIHPGSDPHCTDDDCASPEVLLHTYRVDCDAVGCACQLAVLGVAR